MPLISRSGKLLIKRIFGQAPQLAGSEDCCCPPTKQAGCLRPTRWRIAEAEGDVYAEGAVTPNGLLNNLPSPWIAYWYTKTDLSLKLEVEFPKEGWKTLEEWTSTVITCTEGWFADHSYEDGPPWLQPEPYNCAVLVGDINAEGEDGPEWWCDLTDKLEIMAGIVPCKGFGCWRGPPPMQPGVALEDAAVKFATAAECREFCCPNIEPECVECYLDRGTEYEPKVAPPGNYTFSGEVDGEWNNARNWFDEYDLAPTANILTLAADVTTLSGSPRQASVSGTLNIPEGFSFAIEITIDPYSESAQTGTPHLVILRGVIAATGECPGGRGIVHGYVTAYGSGHVAGTIAGAATFYDSSYTESGAILSVSDKLNDSGPNRFGVYNGLFVFAGNSTNKSGCDTTGVVDLSFAGNATNEAVVGNDVYWWENSRNAAGAVAGSNATFNGNSPDFTNWEYFYFTVGQGSSPRTGGNYGTVGDGASFLNDLDNYNIVTGDASFANADNETNGVVNGIGTFGVEAEAEEDAAFNKGRVDGDGKFFGFSQNAAAGVVKGNGEFNQQAANNGTVEGDGEFNQQAANNGTVEGDGEFNGESSQGEDGIVEGDLTASDSAEIQGTVEGNASFTGSSLMDGATVSLDATFSGTSTAQSGQIDGNATFNEGSKAGDGTLTVGGDVVFDGTSENIGTVEATGTVTFKSGTENSGTIVGDVTFEGGSTNSGTVDGNATFAAGAVNSGDVSGTATFTDATNSGTVATGTFNGASINSGSVTTGTFNGTSTNAALGVVTTGTFNGSSANNGTVTTGTFNGSSSNDGTVATGTFNETSVNGGTVASGTFNNSSENVDGGNLTTATFNDSSANSGSVVNGTFNGTSTNNATISGDATFNDASNNLGAVNGTKTCNTSGTC